MYAPYFIEVFPKLHPAGIRTQLVKIGAEEHLAMEDLRALLIGLLVHGTLEAGRPRGEGAGGDVVLEELAVHNVDHGGNEGFHVFRPGYEGFDVSCRPGLFSCPYHNTKMGQIKERRDQWGTQITYCY